MARVPTASEDMREMLDDLFSIHSRARGEKIQGLQRVIRIMMTGTNQTLREIYEIHERVRCQVINQQPLTLERLKEEVLVDRTLLDAMKSIQADDTQAIASAVQELLQDQYYISRAALLATQSKLETAVKNSIVNNVVVQAVEIIQVIKPVENDLVNRIETSVRQFFKAGNTTEELLRMVRNIQDIEEDKKDLAKLPAALKSIDKKLDDVTEKITRLGYSIEDM